MLTRCSAARDDARALIVASLASERERLTVARVSRASCESGSRRTADTNRVTNASEMPSRIIPSIQAPAANSTIAIRHATAPSAPSSGAGARPARTADA